MAAVQARTRPTTLVFRRTAHDLRVEMPGLADCQRTEERGLRTEKSLGKRIVVTNLFSVALGHWNDSNPIARTTKTRIQIHWKNATAMGRPSDQHYAGRPQACGGCGEPWTISGEAAWNGEPPEPVRENPLLPSNRTSSAEPSWERLSSRGNASACSTSP